MELSTTTSPSSLHLPINQRSYAFMAFPTVAHCTETTPLETNIKSHRLGPLTFRKIVPQFVSQGFGVIVPEMLGYGETERPTEVVAYSRLRIGESLAAILAAESVDKVVVLGHDWVRAKITMKYLRLINL